MKFNLKEKTQKNNKYITSKKTNLAQEDNSNRRLSSLISLFIFLWVFQIILFLIIFKRLLSRPRVSSPRFRVSPNPAEKEKTEQHRTARKYQAQEYTQDKPKLSRGTQSPARNNKSPRWNLIGEGKLKRKRKKPSSQIGAGKGEATHPNLSTLWAKEKPGKATPKACTKEIGWEG